MCDSTRHCVLEEKRTKGISLSYLLSIGDNSIYRKRGVSIAEEDLLCRKKLSSCRVFLVSSLCRLVFIRGMTSFVKWCLSRQLSIQSQFFSFLRTVTQSIKGHERVKEVKLAFIVER